MQQLNKPASRTDDGFTLIELIITVAIVGIVVTALSGMLIQYLKSSVDTQARLAESTDQQFASAYWQQDVSSLGVSGYAAGAADPFPVAKSTWTASAPSGVTGGCASGFPGSLVVGFAWNDYPINSDPDTTWSSPNINAAVYSVVTTDNVTWKLYRTRCIPGKSTATNIVSRNLTEPPTPTCFNKAGSALGSCDTSAVPYTVTLLLKVHSADGTNRTGYNTTLTAQRRQG